MADGSLPDESAVRRFAVDLDRLVPGTAPLGLAVSGGADSLALLLLAAAARPGAVRAVTVDHGLRRESAEEARQVRSICLDREIPHSILKADWPEGPPISNIEASARKIRYARLAHWATGEGLTHIATAHHAEDQAETMLMRLARGAGLSGLTAIREQRPLGEKVTLVRPLLHWPRATLRALVEATGLPIIDDPMNKDPSHDRARLREALREAGFGDAAKFAESAAHLAEAEQALGWAARLIYPHRVKEDGDGLLFAHRGLPREILRRILLMAFDSLHRSPPRGPDLARAIDGLFEGRQAALGGLLLSVKGENWRIAPAPPRRAL
ncbi:tRNA lysidine(34) synthetase TilS [Sphingomicrobium lutaoense]|uniref:tRNA(Ile)-lysidine synthase n=1 Tax=Sphingomicrobium lutaoense TaxID=515949 RepID=A0A839Z309_9SPHN|nr:tRNA lysidine(34) synthetase TilS [Sphingomicrobium lutaoense]MBB3764457.1 tRNA(Ile)-lysidine synthase [Sphingomicrobium lutaoense]